MFDNKEIASKVTGDGEAVSAMVTGVRTMSTAIQAALKVAAASCVVHALEHGNSTPMHDLIEAIGKHSRANSLRKWALEVGPFVWAKDPEDPKSTASLRMDANRRALLSAVYEADPEQVKLDLVSVPFWDFDPEPEFKPVSVLALVKAAVKRVEAVANDPSKVNEANDFNGLVELKQLLVKLAGDKGTKTGKKKSGKAVKVLGASTAAA